MARKPRLYVPGGLTHVMLRGNGGQDIFFAKKDRRRFFALLAGRHLEQRRDHDPELARRIEACNNTIIQA